MNNTKGFKPLPWILLLFVFVVILVFAARTVALAVQLGFFKWLAIKAATFILFAVYIAGAVKTFILDTKKSGKNEKP